MKKYFLLVFIFILSFSGFSQIKVLFDNTHAQRAGSADWTITTGFSNFAADLENTGYLVNSLEHGPIKLEVLSKYDVFIIPEPNNPLKADEINAVKTFVKNGGGLFLISDHAGADRNNNGWDAVKIFNVFVSEFGFIFEEHGYSEHPINNNKYECSIMQGVNEVGSWMGTSIYIKDPSKVLGMISFSSSHGGNPYIIVAAYGAGRIAAVGDSSPFDDGSASKNIIRGGLHNNYKDYDDRQMAINLSKWCAKDLGNELPIVSGSNHPNDNGGSSSNTGEQPPADNGNTNDNNGLVNINTASMNELDALPGIGKATAKLIIDYRESHGPFHSIQEILDIPRINKSNFKLYADKICI